MAPCCTVCDHPSRTEIEREIIAGEPIRHLATRHGLHEAAVRRHRATHLRKALARAREKHEIGEVDGDRIIGWSHELQGKTLVLLERAEKLDDLAAAARLMGKLDATWS